MLERRTEGLYDLFRFAFPHQSVVNVDAEELFPNCTMQQHCQNSGIDSPAQSAEDFPLSDASPDLLDRILDERRSTPATRTPANPVEEVVQNFLAAGRMHDFRMKLYPVQPFRLVADRADGGIGAVPDRFEVTGDSGQMIAMAHPDGDGCFRTRSKPRKEIVRIFHDQLCTSVLPSRRFIHFASQLQRHELEAIADAQNGNSQIEYARRRDRCVCFVGTVRTSGEDDAFRIETTDGFQRKAERMEFRIDAQFSHSPGD